MKTQELKKSVVWKYFAFIKAKDGPATKTNTDMTNFKSCLKTIKKKIYT
jgi:hypothetical protein